MADLTMKQVQEQVGLGTIVLGIDSTKRSPSVVVKTTGVSVRSGNPGIGITVDSSGISLQGKVNFLSSGTGLTKGNYSENNNSSKPFSYTETVSYTAVAQEALYNQLAAQGVDTTSLAKAGVGPPLITDIATAPGVPPHVHVISTKHVHPVEPPLLFKMSPIIAGMGAPINSFQSFLSL